MTYNEHRFIYKATLISFVFALFIFFGCKYDAKKISLKTNSVLQSSQDGAGTAIELFKSSKIVFIGMPDHTLVNAKIFLNEHLIREFHKAGLRYILTEGGIDEGPVYSDEQLRKKWIKLFFPWERVGVVYTPQNIREIILTINAEVPDNERIVFVGLESNRRDFLPEEFSEEYIFNYRDSYMAKNAMYFIDVAPTDAKILILAGNYHGITSEREAKFRTSFMSKPLGAFLKEKYKDTFQSFCYTVLDHDISLSNYWFDLAYSPYWQNIRSSTRYTNVQDMKILYELFPFEFYPEFDGWLIDVHGERGIVYSYKLDNKDVFYEVKKELLDFNNRFLCNTGAIDYTDPDTAYDIASFVRNIYFVKMFYTSEFNYDLYNPPQSLSEALETISEPPAPLALSDKQLKEHISLFYSFSTLAEIENKKDARKALKMYEKDYMRLIHFFPQEIWPLYWLGRVYYKNEDWETACMYYTLFLKHPLAACTQVYMEVLDNIAVCKRELGDVSAAEYYTALCVNCVNEFGIDFSKVNLFMY